MRPSPSRNSSYSIGKSLSIAPRSPLLAASSRGLWRWCRPSPNTSPAGQRLHPSKTMKVLVVDGERDIERSLQGLGHIGGIATTPPSHNEQVSGSRRSLAPERAGPCATKSRFRTCSFPAPQEMWTIGGLVLLRRNQVRKFLETADRLTGDANLCWTTSGPRKAMEGHGESTDHQIPRITFGRRLGRPVATVVFLRFLERSDGNRSLVHPLLG